MTIDGENVWSREVAVSVCGHGGPEITKLGLSKEELRI